MNMTGTRRYKEMFDYKVSLVSTSLIESLFTGVFPSPPL